MRKIGDLQVWHIPQVPGEIFTVDVSSLEEGAKVMNIIADYDQFQFEENIKPDYCNAQGIRRWCADDGGGKPGWEDWYDNETDEDDPHAYLEGDPHDQTI